MVFATVAPLIGIVPKQAHCLICLPFQGTNGKGRLYLYRCFVLLGQTQQCCGSYSKRSCSHSDSEAHNYRCWHCRENAQLASRPFFQPAFAGSEAQVLMLGLPEDDRVWRGLQPLIPPAAGLHPQSRLGQNQQSSGPYAKRRGAQTDSEAHKHRRRQSRENAQRSYNVCLAYCSNNYHRNNRSIRLG